MPRDERLTNIDPVYFLTPIAVIAFSVGLVFYWALRRRFAASALVYALVAYAGAIALKYAVQIPSISWFRAATGGSLLALGVYYGTQAAVFEVGGALLVARYAINRGKLKGADAEGFGLSLAFWENAVLISIPLLLDYLVYYIVLSSPSSQAARTLYSVLADNAPALFYGPQAALPLVGYAIVERVSSLMAHLSWGILCVAAVVLKKRMYFVAALPLGFATDFLAPLAGKMGVTLFELVIFVISGAWLAMTFRVTRQVRMRKEAGAVPETNLLEG